MPCSDPSAAAPRDASPRGLRDGRTCDWCGGPIPPAARRDAVTCSTRCRQARHRFRTAVGTQSSTAGDRPLRLAYADPPYPGLSARYYADHPDYAGEVDHAALLSRLATYDGWALSTSSRALQELLWLAPDGTQVAAWFRGGRGSRSARPVQAWEPVLYFGGRADPDAPVRWDALEYTARPRTTDQARVVGAKPAAFCRWLFELLDARPGDQLDDLYPGSGGVSRAWASYCADGQNPLRASSG